MTTNAAVNHMDVAPGSPTPCLFITRAGGSRRVAEGAGVPLFIFFLEQGVGGRPPAGLQAREGGGLAGEGW